MTAPSDGTGRPNRSDRPVPRKLIAASVKLFADKGFENTSVQEIVAAAGVTKGAMYHYFDSKDDLLYETYSRLLKTQIEHLEEILVRDESAEARIRAMTEDVVRTTIENLEDARVFFRSFHLLPEETVALVRKERHRYGERFGDLIREGRQSGEFTNDQIPLDLLTYHFFGAISYISIWYSPTGTHSVDDVARYYADMLLASLR